MAPKNSTKFSCNPATLQTKQINLSVSAMVGQETPNPKKLRWADLLEDEDNVDNLTLYPLPPREVIGPDENGIKKVIEYKFKAGNIVKVTSTFLVRKVVTKMSKGAIDRRSWAKFGDAVNDKVGSELTSVSSEEIFLERPRVQGWNFFLFLLLFSIAFYNLKVYCQERIETFLEYVLI